MIKKHKLLIIITSVVILLPIAFGFIMWDHLPESIAIHWGINAVADGYAPLLWGILLVPLVLLVIQWLCILISALDFKRNEQDPKLVRTVLWVIPAASLLINGIMYSIALGYNIKIWSLIYVLLGVFFIVIGNYMPKIRRNVTAGIKIKWTLANDENWYVTHRFAGKLYVIAGFIILFCVFIPFNMYSLIASLVIIFGASIIAPTIYSYVFYKKQLREGTATKEEYDKTYDDTISKKGKIISFILVPLILVGVGVVMFTGEINADLGDSSMTIGATYNSSYTLNYSDIESVELRESGDLGSRVYGFASAKLMIGSFTCEEFDMYTRYTYVSCKPYIVIKTNDNVIVINAKTDEATHTLYNEIMQKTGDR